MKLTRFVLKIVGAGLLVAGAACLVIGFWDSILALCCPKAKGQVPSEFDDYADVDCA